MNNINQKDSNILSEVEKALIEHQAGLKPGTNEQNETETDQGSKLARLLRTIGSLVIVVAAVSFLVQRWGGLDHISRYFAFLSFTAGLGVFGIICALKLKEDKSARTFLALAGSLVVVNFAQLAALIYSVFIDRSSSYIYPQYLLWQAPSTGALCLAVAAGLPILAFISIASFSVLARENRFAMIAGFLCMNLALLVPLRDSISTGILIALMVGVLKFTYVNFKQSAILKTFESRVAQVQLLLPLLVIASRATYLYDVSSMLVGLICLSLTVLLFSVLPQLFEELSFKIASQRISILTAAIGIFCLVESVLSHISAGSEFLVPVSSVPFIACLIYMSFKGAASGSFERSLAVAVGILSVVIQLLSYPGLFTFTYVLLVSILISSYGFIIKEKFILLCGLAGIGLSLINHLKFAYYIGLINPWISLAILGTLTIFAAAYAEKRAQFVIVKLNKLKSEIANWK